MTAVDPAAGGLLQPQDPVLRRVYWREEIVEVALWLRGEGMDERLDDGVLSRFLGLPAQDAEAHLHRLAAEGYLTRLPDGRYRLDRLGEEEGRQLVDGFRAVPPPRLGPGGTTCWCRRSAAGGAACGGSAPTGSGS